MKKSHYILCLAGGLLMSLPQTSHPQAPSQYPVLDKIADKVILKYQNTSCDDLKAKKQQQAPEQRPALEQKAIDELKNNADKRKYFLDKVASPIANKMFECGMVP